MIVEFLRIIATLLLIVIILMDDFPFYNKLRDQSVQFILALLTLIIIYYDTTLGFIVALILMIMYYEIYSKIIKRYKENEEILKDNKSTNSIQVKTPPTILDEMNTLNNNYDQYLETDPNCDPIKLKYVSEEHLLSAQNNIVDEKAYMQEIKGMACNGENERSVYAAQGLDSDSVNYLGYEKSNYQYAPL